MKQFRDLGWHLIPLEGELIRLPGGKKTVPKFPKNWNDPTISFESNDKALNIVLTGQASNIVILDCDTPETYQTFRALDPDNAFVFTSRDKTEKGITGHIIYKYDPELSQTFKVNTEVLQLDFKSNNSGVYLPGPKNHTKENFTVIGEPKEVPKTIKSLLIALKPKVQAQTLENVGSAQYDYHFIDVIPSLLEGSPNKILLKALTPRAFRSLPKYLDMGFLHPADVPNGRGSEYLSQVSAILGADVSIDATTYRSAILKINELFSDPMDLDRLLKTIIEPMVSGEAKGANGLVIWQYDKNFSKKRYIIQTKTGDQMEIFYDADKLTWYVANMNTRKVKMFSTDSAILSHLCAIGTEPLTKPKLQKRVPLFYTRTLLNKPFGYMGSNLFNLFQSTNYLKILMGDEHVKDYDKPVVILQFLESLIPDKISREYMLKFIKRKFTTLHYSPVVLNFVGVSGAGKDLFVQLLSTIIGTTYLAKPSAKEFIEPYNHYLVDKFLVQCDEYGDQFTRYDQKQQALGRLKTYTGSSDIQIRQMRTDGYNYKHCLTFILTSNKQPLVLDTDDRRLLMLLNPNKLNTQSWVAKLGGVAIVVQKLQEEVAKFCQYLRDEIDMLEDSEYMEPPFTIDKQTTIEMGMGIADLISHHLLKRNYKALYDLAIDCGITDIYDKHEINRIYENTLFEIYKQKINYDSTIRVFRNIISKNKVPKKDTTSNGRKSFYYEAPGLHEWYMSNIKKEPELKAKELIGTPIEI